MSIFARILLGVVIAAVGFAVVWKSYSVVEFVGRSYWAETKFSMWGGTTGLVKVIGVAVIFIGFMMITNLHQDFLTWLVEPLIRTQRR